MKKSEFIRKSNALGYRTKRDSVEDELFVIDNGAMEDCGGYYVARILENETYGVYFDYCTPFTKEIYDLIFEFTSTPEEER